MNVVRLGYQTVSMAVGGLLGILVGSKQPDKHAQLQHLFILQATVGGLLIYFGHESTELTDNDTGLAVVTCFTTASLVSMDDV
jgi:hypothetical protein